MTAIQAFSDWMLAALPRLFLYPGGLWLLATLLVLRVASGGARAIRPNVLARDFLASPPLSLAVGWVTVALLPLPGVVTLPVQPDRLALVFLPLISLVSMGAETWRSVWPAVGITLALLVPLVGGESLFLRQGDWTVSTAMSALAVGVGLLALCREAARDPAAAMRWLAWLGLGASPMMEWPQAPVAGFVWASGLYLLLIVTLALAGRRLAGRVRWDVLASATITLSLLALLSALLGY